MAQTYRVEFSEEICSAPAGALRLQTRSVLLPAIAAVAAIAAASATATTSAASAAPAAVSAAPAATTAALCLGTCFIHHEVSPAKILAIQGINGAVRILVTIHFHEGETARLARESVADEIDPRRCNSNLGKPLLKLFLRRGKRKITDIELLHLLLLLPGTHMRVAERAEETAIVHCEAKKRGRRGSETGTSAVFWMVSEIDPFCNWKLSRSGRRISAGSPAFPLC